MKPGAGLESAPVVDSIPIEPRRLLGLEIAKDRAAIDAYIAGRTCGATNEMRFPESPSVVFVQHIAHESKQSAFREDKGIRRAFDECAK